MLQSLAKQIGKSLKRHGLSGTLWLALKNVFFHIRGFGPARRRARRLEQEFDREFEVDTGGLVSLSDHTIESENYEYGHCYQATSPGAFREMMRPLRITHKDFIFIDFGSGKGRTLLLASELPFKRIIGVEFSPQLNRIAEDNIRRYRSRSRTQKCERVESVCVDAAVYPIPPEPAVFYFYDPFEERVMARVLDNIRDSLAEHPREVFIVYCNPVLDGLLNRAGFLEKLLAADHHVIYRNVV